MDGTGHEEGVAQTEVGQWPGWNMEDREEEEKVTETTVGKWSSWNMEGTRHEEQLRRRELVSGQARIWTADKTKKKLL